MSAPRPLEVLTVGEALVVLTGEHVGLLGEETGLRIGTGGAELNVAVALARLGVRAGWAGAVSADELGRHVLRRLRAEQLDTSMMTVETGPTGVIFKQPRAARRVSIEYLRHDSAGSRWQAAPIVAAGFGGAGWLHVSGVTPALGPPAATETRRLLERARDAGVKVSFDVNFRARLWSPSDAAPVLRELVALADLVFADEPEAELAGVGMSPPRTQEIVVRGPSRVVSSSPRDGVHELGWETVPGVDPIGAGDAFAAGYLYARLREAPVAERLATACELGRWAARTDGDHANLPYRDEFDERLAGAERR